MKINKKKLTQLLTVALMLSTATVNAEVSPTEEFSFDKVVVTAQRKETKELETPASTTIITGQELKDSGALSVFDALERTVGVHSYSYGTAGQEYGSMFSRVMVRGLDKGTLVLVNGAPVNLMNYNTMGVIPVEAVDRIEIVKGSNAVLYGAEAMGGVINIITKKAAGESSGSVSTTYGNYYKDNSVTINDKDFMFFYKKEIRNEVDDLNRLFTTSFDKLSLGKGNKESLFLNLNLTDELSFNYSYSNNESNFKKWKYNSVDKNYTTLVSNSIYYDKRNNVNLVYDNKDIAVKSVLAYNSINLKGAGNASTTDYDLYGINFDNQKTWKLRNGQDSLVAGLTLQRENYEKESSKKFHRDSYALYGSYNRQMSENLVATLGLREHFVKANSYDESQNILLPQLQTLYKIDDQTSWYTNIGKSFEMPATSSPFYMAKVSTALKLKPQEGWTYETGIKHINGNESFKVALFAMEIDNKFKWVKEDTVIPGGDPNSSIQINNDKFRNKGIELEYNKRLNDSWQYNLGASFSDPESKNGNGNWAQDEAKLQLSAGATYTEKKIMTNLDFFYLGKRQMAYYNMEGKNTSQDHRIGDRIDMNATVQYKATDRDSFTLSGYNLLDRGNPINPTEYWSTPINYRLTYTRTL
ncbi:colicin I receptor [Sporomusaceae bacterium FL31]|nr:colicin I receptor [Sporomusaceae bacterium FL31]GCE34038.1 colicin I receptor [Sporomusaceae bacterium]